MPRIGIAIFQSYVKSKLSTLNDEATEPFELISDKWYYKVYADFDADFWDKYNALEAEGDEDGINAIVKTLPTNAVLFGLIIIFVTFLGVQAMIWRIS